MADLRISYSQYETNFFAQQVCKDCGHKGTCKAAFVMFSIHLCEDCLNKLRERYLIQQSELLEHLEEVRKVCWPGSEDGIDLP